MEKIKYEQHPFLTFQTTLTQIIDKRKKDTLRTKWKESTRIASLTLITRDNMSDGLEKQGFTLHHSTQHLPRVVGGGFAHSG